jgi:hypothetical protein
MKAPEDFVKKLTSQSDGDLRIRWSHSRGEWHIEQRVGRAILAPSPISDDDDEHRRAADGYVLVLTVRDGDRMPCPDCGCELKVPHLRFAEVKCDYCRLQGRDGRHVAGHFPLGEALLQHLRRIDPKRGWRDGMKEALDRRNHQLVASRERDYSNMVEAVGFDHARQLMKIGQWGYNSPHHPKEH